MKSPVMALAGFEVPSFSRKVMLSGVCPGVCITSSVIVPRRILLPFFKDVCGNWYCQSFPPSSERYKPAPVAARSSREPLKKSRSEEHTSELQSRENLVCRLLLEKKKK